MLPKLKVPCHHHCECSNNVLLLTNRARRRHTHVSQNVKYAHVIFIKFLHFILVVQIGDIVHNTTWFWKHLTNLAP